MSNIRKEYISGSAEIEHFGKKLEVKLRYSGQVQRGDSEYIGLHNIMNMEMQDRKNRENDHTHTHTVKIKGQTRETPFNLVLSVVS